MMGGLKLMPDVHCPTWNYLPLKGWRRILTQYFFLPAKWFKHERERVFYKVGDTMICSYENYALALKEIEARPML